MFNKTYDAQICTWLEQHRDEIVENLMTLMRVPSVRGEAAPGAPYGVECRRAIEASQQLFASLGFATRMEADRGYALAEYGTGEKTIGLFGHADVVPPGDGWIHTQPFDPIIKNDTIIGRGCADDKAGIVASACVMTMVRDLGLPVRSRLLAYAGANEETGMNDIQAFVASETCPDISIVPDGDFPCSLGEKGKLIMWAECDTPFTAIRDFSGGLSTNVVLGKVDITFAPDKALEEQLRALAASRSDCTLTVSDDGSLLLCVEGVGGHASWPEGTVNAGALAARLLCDCPALSESDRAILATVRDYVTDPFGVGSGIAHEDPRFGRLSAANGLMKTVDGKLRLSMDTRYGTAMPTETLKAKLLQVWGSRGWTLLSMDSREAFHVDESSPVPEMIRTICLDLTGVDRPCFRMSGGTYSHYLPNGFSCGTCFKKSGLTLGAAAEAASAEDQLTFPEGHGGVHQPDESLDIEGFLLAIRIIAHTVLQCDELLYS